MDTASLKAKFPIVGQLAATEEVVWANPHYGESAELVTNQADLFDAAARLQRFAPFFVAAFPETAAAHGILESPLKRLTKMQDALTAQQRSPLLGELYLKADNELPISGSIKSRGGIYEVLKIAEGLAIASGRLTYMADYSVLADPTWHQFFSQYGIAVGSTGNLGLSIGIVAAKLGFNTTVHMSRDAKQWKKEPWIIHLGIWDMKSHLAGLKATFGALRILTERRSW